MSGGVDPRVPPGLSVTLVPLGSFSCSPVITTPCGITGLCRGSVRKLGWFPSGAWDLFGGQGGVSLGFGVCVGG